MPKPRRLGHRDAAPLLPVQVKHRFARPGTVQRLDPPSDIDMPLRQGQGAVLDRVAGQLVQRQGQDQRRLRPEPQPRTTDRSLLAFPHEVEQQFVRYETVQVRLALHIRGGLHLHHGSEPSIEMRHVALDIAGALGGSVHDRAHHRRCVAQSVTQAVGRTRSIQQPTQAGVVGFQGSEPIRQVSWIGHADTPRRLNQAELPADVRVVAVGDVVGTHDDATARTRGTRQSTSGRPPRAGRSIAA